MRTVELLCDAALDDAVREVWRRLRAAGLPSLDTHRHPTNRPHLTVAAADRLPPQAALVAALGGLPVRVRLDGPLFFDGRLGMAAWRVVPDDPLRMLHTAVWQALAPARRHPLHAPQVWTPHVSLARRVRPQQRAAVAAVLGDGVMAGELVAARSYDSATRTVTALT